MDTLVRPVPVEADFGLENSTLEDLRAGVAELPFDTAVLFYARLAAEAWHAGTDKARQLAIVREIFPPTAGAIAGIERFLNEHEGGAFLIEQQLFALLRLVIEHAQPGAIDENNEQALRDFSTPSLRALFRALTVVTESIQALPGGDQDREKWLAVLIQNGGYNAKSPPMNAFTRARRLLELSEVDGIGEPQDRCDIVQWLQDDYKLSIDEQFAAGFALGAVVGSFDNERPSSEIGLLPRDRLQAVLQQLGLENRQEAVLDLISAPRSWYADRFAQAEGSAMDVAWRRAPFEQRPFIRWGDGHLLLLSPRALLSWLGEGFQHRAFACAARRGEATKQRYMRFFGQLVEAYALELAESVYPSTRRGRRVHGELRYGKGGGKKTSDIAVDSAPDLVLVEVGAGRLKEASRVLAQRDDVAADLRKLVLVRMKKLNGVVDALKSGEARLPEVEETRLREIWPVIVTAGSVLQSDLLWDYVEDNRAELLTQDGVQPLTLLDLDDFELLMGLVESGSSLVDLLRRKTRSEFQRFDLQQWVSRDPLAPREQRPRMMEQRMRDIFLAFGERLGLDPTQLSAIGTHQPK